MGAKVPEQLLDNSALVRRLKSTKPFELVC
jgi:hypothetical protein